MPIALSTPSWPPMSTWQLMYRIKSSPTRVCITYHKLVRMIPPTRRVTFHHLEPLPTLLVRRRGQQHSNSDDQKGDDDEFDPTTHLRARRALFL